MATLADEVAASYTGDLDVVGVSLGGMVGQHLALRHPDRVRSVVVACTGAAASPELMAERARAVEEGGMAAVLDATLQRWFTGGALGIRPEHPGVAYARRTLLALDPRSFADAWRAIGGHDLRDRLAGIRAQVTCLAGSADAALPLPGVQEIAGRVPASRLVVVDGPHMLQLECPAEFSEAVREHLRWVEDG
jgi:pimeloyl-ACP methyl ester carboxylesterase